MNDALYFMSLFTAGAFVMRGAGCTINDLWDMQYDRRVERTQNRPLASGRVTPVRALAFCFAQLSIGLVVVVQLPIHALALAFGAMPLVVIYPLMKRFFAAPQLILGLTFNWGALVGYASITGIVDSAMLQHIVPLYVAGVFHTLIYDTLYAHQDTRDDQQLGLRSTALTFGTQSRCIMSTLLVCYTAALLQLGVVNDLSWMYYTVAVAGSSLHLVWQLKTVDLQNRASCARMFRLNSIVGLLLLLGIAMDRLLFVKDKDTVASKQHTAVERQPSTWQLIVREWRAWRHHDNKKNDSHPDQSQGRVLT